MFHRRILAAALPGLCIGLGLGLCVCPCDRAAVGGAGVRPGAAVDPRFPAAVTRTIGGKPVRLTLTGTAVRRKYGFSVYSVASYLREGLRVRDADGLSRADAAKELHLIFDRDVDGATMARAFRASIGMSHPAPAFGAELASLEKYFLSHPLKQGDHVRLTHVPGVGLGCQVGGQTPVVVGGVGFAQAAWGTYLGPNHLGVAIKDGLTSRL